MDDLYLWMKALHILAVIAWMAGMLMLPRLYAYQTEAEPGGELEAKMIEASQRLQKIILNPTMILSWVFGLYLAHWQYQANGGMPGWLWAKLALALLGMTALHGFVVGQGKRLAKGERRYSSKTWRLLNEVPFILAIPIVILVILKPF